MLILGTHVTPHVERHIASVNASIEQRDGNWRATFSAA